MDYIDHHYTSICTLHRKPCIRKYIIMADKKRPVFRVGYAVQIEGMRWAKVRGDEIFSFCSNADISKEYPSVYTITCTRENVGTIISATALRKTANMSFEKSEISQGSAESLFFSVIHGGCKLGYLLTDFTGNELLIRSFLFTTNTGTKEGLEFNNRLRIETYSKKYFELDSHITYITSDICIDPYFSSILTECVVMDWLGTSSFFPQSI